MNKPDNDTYLRDFLITHLVERIAPGKKTQRTIHGKIKQTFSRQLVEALQLGCLSILAGCSKNALL